MLRVRLDRRTVEAAEAEAWLRHEVSRAAGITDRQIGGQSSEVTDLVGLLGEIGFGLMFDLKRDDTVAARSGGVDFVGHDGSAIEVKSSHHANPHLLIPAYQVDGKWTVKEPIDWYALMHVDYQDSSVGFVGWASRREVVNDERLQDFMGRGRLSFVVPPDELGCITGDRLDVVLTACAARGVTAYVTP